MKPLVFILAATLLFDMYLQHYQLYHVRSWEAAEVLLLFRFAVATLMQAVGVNVLIRSEKKDWLGLAAKTLAVAGLGQAFVLTVQRIFYFVFLGFAQTFPKAAENSTVAITMVALWFYAIIPGIGAVILASCWNIATILFRLLWRKIGPVPAAWGG